MYSLSPIVQPLTPFYNLPSPCILLGWNAPLERDWEGDEQRMEEAEVEDKGLCKTYVNI